MNLLRFGLKPSCVYFNPTERCNLRRHMSAEEVLMVLESLKCHMTLSYGQVQEKVVTTNDTRPSATSSFSFLSLVVAFNAVDRRFEVSGMLDGTMAIRATGVAYYRVISVGCAVITMATDAIRRSIGFAAVQIR
jgi:hypothetical protein